MKKHFSGLFLPLLLALSLSLFSCATPEPEAPSGSEAPPLSSVQNEEEKVNLQGLEIKIAYFNGITNEDSMLMYGAKTILGDKVADRYASIASDYNCTISPFTYNSTSLLVSETASGTISANMIFGGTQQVFHEIAAGGGYNALSDYADILDYETNDYKWGTVHARELGMLGGVQYALNPYSWPEARPNVASVMTANEDLIAQFNKTDPRELVEQKKWGWQDFEDYIIDCTFTDNVDYYGFGGNNFRDVICGFFLSNGCEVVNVADDGTYTTDIESPAGIAAIEEAMRIGREMSDCFYGGKITHAVADTVAADYFLEGTTFVWHTTSGVYTSYIAYNMKNTAFLPFPVGPEGSYGEWSGFTFGANTLGLPYDVDDGEYVALVLGEICEPLDGITDYDSLLQYYTDNVFFDSRDARLFLSVNDNARYTMNYYPVGGHTFWTDLGTTKKTAIEYIESKLPKQKEIIDEYMVPNALYINEMLSRG